MHSSTRTRRHVVAVLTAVVLGTAGLVASPSPGGAACPTLGPSDRWISPYTFSGGSSSNWSDGHIASSGNTVTGSLDTLNGNPTNPNSLTGQLNCGAFTGTLTGIVAGKIKLTATLRDNGDEFVDGTWEIENSPTHGTWSSARVLQQTSLPNVTSITTDGDSSGATTTEPVTVGITSPTPGTLAIATGRAANPVLNGYQLLDQVVHIEAPPATAADPLVFTFVLDASTLLGAPAGEVKVFRNGSLLADCTDLADAIPDPCVASRIPVAGGDVEVTVRSSQASIWAFGVNGSRGGFRVLNTSLPNAKVGTAYAATLGAVGGTPPYKFKKLAKLPKGLKLKAKTGVLSGTPKAAGTFAVRVLVLDKAKPRKTTSKIFSIVVTP